ncbi:MAG: MBL fold metallo-hydrolase, partial [Deltaproteobacteria bacterium]
PGAPLAVVDPGASFCWLLVGLVLVVARKPPRWRLLVAAGAVGAVLLGSHAAWMRWRSDRLDAVFLSVGHGDASIVRLPGGRVAVIDGGGRGRGRLVVGPMLRRMRIARIDYLIVSHVQSDHWPGALELAREFGVGELWYSGGACSNADFREALARLRESGTRIVDAGSGDPIVRSGLQGWLLRVLWPPGGSGSCDDNDRSLVVEASFAGTRILWTGDIEETAEHRLARRVARADILKVAHHGSHTSSSAAFLAAVAPSYAVVSVSKYNRFGLPDEKVLARLRQAGARILRTDRDGAITAAVTAAGPSVNPAKRL